MRDTEGFAGTRGLETTATQEEFVMRDDVGMTFAEEEEIALTEVSEEPVTVEE